MLHLPKNHARFQEKAAAAAERFPKDPDTSWHRCDEGLPCCQASGPWVADAAAWHRRRRLQQRRERLVLLSAADRRPVEAAAAGSGCGCCGVTTAVSCTDLPLLHTLTVSLWCWCTTRRKKVSRQSGDKSTPSLLWHFGLIDINSCYRLQSWRKALKTVKDEVILDRVYEHGDGLEIIWEYSDGLVSMKKKMQNAGCIAWHTPAGVPWPVLLLS